MGRRRQFSGRAFPRRLTSWEIGVGGFEQTPVTVTSSSVSTVGLGAQSLEDGLTIVRIRGLISLVLSAVDAPLSGFQGAFGICIVSQDAAAVGPTAIPDPVVDEDWDGWMWHQYYSLIQPIAFAAQSAASAVEKLVIDTKAMRKFAANDVLILIGEHLETGTCTMTVSADSRVLVKLP